MLHTHVLAAFGHNRAGSARNNAELIPLQAHLPDPQAVFDVKNLHGFALIRKVNLPVGQHAIHIENHQSYARQNALQIASHASKVKPSAVGRNAKSFRRNNAERPALVREKRFFEKLQPFDRSPKASSLARKLPASETVSWMVEISFDKCSRSEPASITAPEALAITP